MHLNVDENLMCKKTWWVLTSLFNRLCFWFCQRQMEENIFWLGSENTPLSAIVVPIFSVLNIVPLPYTQNTSSSDCNAVGSPWVCCSFAVKLSMRTHTPDQHTYTMKTTVQQCNQIGQLNDLTRSCSQKHRLSYEGQLKAAHQLHGCGSLQPKLSGEAVPTHNGPHLSPDPVAPAFLVIQLVRIPRVYIIPIQEAWKSSHALSQLPL